MTAPTRRDICMGAMLALGGAFAADAASATQTHSKKGAAMPANPVNSSHDLSLQTARMLVDDGLDLAAQRGLKLVIAVVDRAGHLLAFARMDGAALISIEVAIGKARTAAFMQAPSRLFEEAINSGKPSLATVPGALPLQGGMPVTFNGEIVGAVGVSGASGEADQEMATIIAGSLGKP